MSHVRAASGVPNPSGCLPGSRNFNRSAGRRRCSAPASVNRLKPLDRQIRIGGDGILGLLRGDGHGLPLDLPDLQPREASDPGEYDSTKDEIATGYGCACPEGSRNPLPEQKVSFSAHC